VVALLDGAETVGGAWSPLTEAWKYVKNSEKVGNSMSDVFSIV
jgi:hypothetical protein